MKSQGGFTVKHPKILIIDDDEQFSKDLSFLMNGLYWFVVATESKEGIEFLKKEKFDLVILDLVMPAHYAEEDEEEGIEVLRLIREKWGVGRERKIPVIILTKMDTEQNKKICFKLNASAFLTKPPDVEVLKEEMNEILKKNNLLLYPNKQGGMK